MPRQHHRVPPLSWKDIARFWSKVKLGGVHDCWPWRGGHKPNSYGQLRIKGGTYTAHRVAYLLAHGADF